MKLLFEIIGTLAFFVGIATICLIIAGVVSQS
jgi:hypothetical protein